MMFDKWERPIYNNIGHKNRGAERLRSAVFTGENPIT
jgi:hypothetical protein